MIHPNHPTPAALAVYAVAAIKTATEAFDNGDINVWDALDAINEAIDDFRARATDRSQGEAA